MCSCGGWGGGALGVVRVNALEKTFLSLLLDLLYICPENTEIV